MLGWWVGRWVLVGIRPGHPQGWEQLSISAAGFAAEETEEKNFRPSAMMQKSHVCPILTTTCVADVDADSWVGAVTVQTVCRVEFMTLVVIFAAAVVPSPTPCQQQRQS